MKPNVSSASELQNKANYDHVQIAVSHEDDEPLNCEIVDGNKGVVMFVKICEGSALHGKVQPGDYCITVNGKAVSNKTELFKIALKADPELTVVVARPKSVAVRTPPPTKQSPQQQKTEIATATSSRSSVSTEDLKSDDAQKATDPKRLAVVKGFNVKPDREYVQWRVKTTGTGKPLGMGIMRVTRENATIVSTVQPNSVSVEFFKPGDRFLTINDTVIPDVQVCRKMIMETKGNFDVLIERPPNGMATYGISKVSSAPPLKCSYVKPSPSNPEEELGDPLVGYETAPADVQNFIIRQLPILMKAFGVGSQRSSQRGAVQQSDRLKIEHDVHEHAIESDVAPGSMLRKPPKRT